jgi:hypothetical protein
MQLSDWFLAGLKNYDGNLSARYDDFQDEIHILYSKSGKKSLAYSVKREHAEYYPDWQRRILRELPLKDVWKRHGSGEKYDDFLEAEETKHRAMVQKALDDERMAGLTENKHYLKQVMENMKQGKIHAHECDPYKLQGVQVPEMPKEARSESV